MHIYRMIWCQSEDVVMVVILMAEIMDVVEVELKAMKVMKMMISHLHLHQQII